MSGDYVNSLAVGGPGSERIDHVVVDAAGSRTVIGTFTGTADFAPIKASQSLKTSAGKTDAFAWKLTPRGYLAWVVSAGGGEYDIAKDVAVNPVTGDAYVVGCDPATGGVYLAASFTGTVAGRTSAGGYDALLAKFTRRGALLTAGALGGAGDDHASAVAYSPATTVLFGGSYTGRADLDPSPDAAQRRTAAGADDPYLVEVTA